MTSTTETLRGFVIPTFVRSCARHLTFGLAALGLAAALGCASLGAGRHAAEAATGCRDFDTFAPVPRRYMMVASGGTNPAELHRGCGNYILVDCAGFSAERSCRVLEVMPTAEAEASDELYSRDGAS